MNDNTMYFKIGVFEGDGMWEVVYGFFRKSDDSLYKADVLTFLSEEEANKTKEDILKMVDAKVKKH